jgi:hypothetical protein
MMQLRCRGELLLAGPRQYNPSLDIMNEELWQGRDALPVAFSADAAATTDRRDPQSQGRAAASHDFPLG